MEKLVSAVEAAQELKISPRGVRSLCKSGRLAGAQLIGGSWVIPSPVARVSMSDLAGCDDDEDWLTLSDVARRLGVTRSRVHQLLQGGRLVGARQFSGKWFVPSPVEVLSIKAGRE